MNCILSLFLFLATTELSINIDYLVRDAGRLDEAEIQGLGELLLEESKKKEPSYVEMQKMVQNLRGKIDSIPYTTILKFDIERIEEELDKLTPPLPPPPPIKTYAFRAKRGTFFKKRPLQSGDLSEREKCLIETGETLIATHHVTNDDHVLICLESPLLSCEFEAGYIFSEHFFFLEESK